MLQGKDCEFSQNAAALSRLIQIYCGASRSATLQHLQAKTHHIPVRHTTPLFLAKTAEYPSLTCQALCFSSLQSLQACQSVLAELRAAVEHIL